jgi:levanase/fructan beta-fructosidase
MTIAREIGLIKTTQGYRLTNIPVEEAQQTLESLTPVSKVLLGNMKLELAIDLKKKVGYVLSNDLGEKLEFGYDPAKQHFYIDRTKAGKNDFSEKFAPKLSYAPRFTEEKTIQGTIILDKTSIELFLDNGQTVMTEIFFPNAPFNQITKIE